MLLGDSEHLPALRPKHNGLQQDAPREASIDQQSQKHTQTGSQENNTSSVSSDSAHVPLHHMPQLGEAADDQSEAHSMLIRHHLVATTQRKHRFLHHHQSARLTHLS